MGRRVAFATCRSGAAFHARIAGRAQPRICRRHCMVARGVAAVMAKAALADAGGAGLRDDGGRRRSGDWSGLTAHAGGAGMDLAAGCRPGCQYTRRCGGVAAGTRAGIDRRPDLATGQIAAVAHAPHQWPTRRVASPSPQYVRYGRRRRVGRLVPGHHAVAGGRQRVGRMGIPRIAAANMDRGGMGFGMGQRKHRCHHAHAGPGQCHKRIAVVGGVAGDRAPALGPATASRPLPANCVALGVMGGRGPRHRFALWA